MMNRELADTVAYCGLVCGICTLGPELCDCRTTPKPEAMGYCHQRTCCIEKGIDGCWECEGFPCGHGYFGPDSQGYRGVCIAFVQFVKDEGRDALVRLLVQRHGAHTDYAEYVDKTPKEVMQILCGAEGRNSVH